MATTFPFNVAASFWPNLPTFQQKRLGTDFPALEMGQNAIVSYIIFKLYQASAYVLVEKFAAEARFPEHFSRLMDTQWNVQWSTRFCTAYPAPFPSPLCALFRQLFCVKFLLTNYPSLQQILLQKIAIIWQICRPAFSIRIFVKKWSGEFWKKEKDGVICALQTNINLVRELFTWVNQMYSWWYDGIVF